MKNLHGSARDSTEFLIYCNEIRHESTWTKNQIRPNLVVWPAEVRAADLHFVSFPIHSSIYSTAQSGHGGWRFAKSRFIWVEGLILER